MIGNKKIPYRLFSIRDFLLFHRTRSGRKELNPYKTPIKYNTLIISTKTLGYIVKYCK